MTQVNFFVRQSREDAGVEGFDIDYMHRKTSPTKVSESSLGFHVVTTDTRAGSFSQFMDLPSLKEYHAAIGEYLIGLNEGEDGEDAGLPTGEEAEAAQQS